VGKNKLIVKQSDKTKLRAYSSVQRVISKSKFSMSL